MSLKPRGKGSQKSQVDLEKAIFFGKLGSVNKLIRNGVDLDKPNEIMERPIHIAAAAGNVKLVSLLLSHGCDVNVTNNQGNTPLINACMNDFVEVIQLLMEAGSDAKVVNNKGETAADFLKLSHKKLVMSKKEINALVNPAEGESKDTLLHRAAFWGKAPRVKKLVLIGANKDVRNKYRETPLHVAVAGGRYKTTEALLKLGCNIDRQNIRGETALHVAAKKEIDLLIPLLMEYQPDVSMKDKAGKLARDYAASKKAQKYLLPSSEAGGQVSNAKVIGKYTLGKTLGVGGFGKVKLAVHNETGEKVAIKIITKSFLKKVSDAQERLKKEIAIMKFLNHPNVIRFTEFFETAKHIYVVMQFIDGVELFDYIIQMEMIPEAVARQIFQQIVSGLSYCHKLNIIHRDMKPENIMINTTTLEVKIIDFGLSNLNISNLYMTACGSPHYAAPEMLSGRVYGPAVDIWSLGITLYAMLFGCLPFEEDAENDLMKNIFDMESKLSFPMFASREVSHLIRRMLAVHPENRLSIEDIRKHPWVRLPPERIYRIPKGHSIDMEIVGMMAKEYGIEQGTIVQAISNRTTESITMIYAEVYRSKLES